MIATVVQQKAEELGNPECIAKYLHEKIKYEFYLVSKTPSLTLRRKRGNCTDIALLAVAMLQAIGLHAEINYDTSIEVPHPNVVFMIEKEKYILDTVCEKNYGKNKEFIRRLK